MARIEKNYTTDWITKDPDKLEDRICFGLKNLMDAPNLVASICTFPIAP